MILARGAWVWHNWVSLALLLASGADAFRVVYSETGGTAPSQHAERAVKREGSNAAPEQELRNDLPHLDGLVLASVSRNPFNPGRARGAGRYRTAAAAALAAATASPPLPPAPPPMPPPLDVAIVLRGIATDSRGRTLAAVEIAGQNRLMRVGEEFAGHRLIDARSGTARLQGPNGIRTVRLGS
jgi:hypothetical protein